MISFVCWKWHTPNTKRQFHAEHVNVLRAMVARWYRQPFRFICITDDPRGLEPKIEALPLPVSFDQVRSPHGERFPSCYRRLWNFSHEAKALLGERILQIDIDVVICGELAPIVERAETFVGWCDPHFQDNKIAGGAYLLQTGTLAQVWEEFDPHRSPAEAFQAGFMGSDQGWMSYMIYPPPGRWRAADGLLKLRWTAAGARKAPAGARMVFTSGVTPPWDAKQQGLYPWIKDHWRI